ncbi:MAG: hydrolase [Alteromonas sp.]|nr:hydrolase [Alteromonas sp.]MAY22079.1 hydrolase [Flavobacteriaceae bacterium]|tara:strand:- start:17793 stop:18617 length:825 start_codon:yes stop_codon:yes gene_type:complete
MKTLKYKSRGNEVFTLEELLLEMGYEVYISNYFGKDTDAAVRDFQLKNDLVVDGIVGPKTWAKIYEQQQRVTFFNDKFLSEKDLQEFSKKYQLELATVKAVNEVESSGKGFLLDGRPRILFEGHIFWKQLQKKAIDPNELLSEKTDNILYPQWTKKYYEGGKQEYDRLEKAAGLSDNDHVHDAAYEAASYGSFQIMGFHWKSLGYPTIDSFVAHMYTHEKAHLDAFGKFCEANHLLNHLRNKDWAAFAKGYNGSGYAKNKYDLKLAKAYHKYHQ